MQKTLHSYLPISCICSYRLHEVHSSQTGETSKHLKKTISKGESGEEEDIRP